MSEQQAGDLDVARQDAVDEGQAVVGDGGQSGRYRAGSRSFPSRYMLRIQSNVTILTLPTGVASKSKRVTVSTCFNFEALTEARS
jgi:hypothetical protein